MDTSANNISANSKIERSQRIVRNLLTEYAAYFPDNSPGSENQLITDVEHGHFQLVCIDWEGDVFRHNTIFHFDIKSDGKIWILVNRTDIDIAAKLVEAGVEKSDIVIGFQPPRYRPYTGYAVA